MNDETLKKATNLPNRNKQLGDIAGENFIIILGTFIAIIALIDDSLLWLILGLFLLHEGIVWSRVKKDSGG